MKRAIIATLAAAAAFLTTMAHGQDAETYRPTVPLMLPATDSFLQSFVRLINKSNEAGEVSITAVDDGGNVYDTVTIQLAALQTFHFNSGDLTDGNANKGIGDGIGAPMQGNWRLQIETDLDVEALSFTRARDGFLTATHELLPAGNGGYLVKIFNPASNTTQQSRLRLINWGAEDETVRIEGVDDGGNRAGPVSLTLPAGHSRILTAVDLEEGAEGLEGTLGDGSGKWQLNVRGNARSIAAQSLLYASSGHISNISAEGFSAVQGGDGGRIIVIDNQDSRVRGGSGGADCSAALCYGAIAVIDNGAISDAAIDGDTLPRLVAGVSWGYSTQVDANERAFTECGHQRCTVEREIERSSYRGSFDACAAAAVGWDELTLTPRFRQSYVSRGETLRAAQFDALNECRDDYDECELWEGVAACGDGSHLD